MRQQNYHRYRRLGVGEVEGVGVGVGEKRQSDMGSHFWTTVPSSGLTSCLQNVVL